VTTRAALLGIVVSALALLLALPLRTYLGQHAEITSLQTAQTQQQQRIETLRRTINRAQDPVVVEQQARERLQLTFPGQVDYVVVPPSAAPAPPPPTDRPTTVVPVAPRQAWWSSLWASTEAAGRSR